MMLLVCRMPTGLLRGPLLPEVMELLLARNTRGGFHKRFALMRVGENVNFAPRHAQRSLGKLCGRQVKV
jgi:hypothetical protein